MALVQVLGDEERRRHRVLGALLQRRIPAGLPTGLPRGRPDTRAEHRYRHGGRGAVGFASLENAVAAFVGGLTSTMWVSAAICLLGAAMVWRYLPDSRR